MFLKTVLKAPVTFFVISTAIRAGKARWAILTSYSMYAVRLIAKRYGSPLNYYGCTILWFTARMLIFYVKRRLSPFPWYGRSDIRRYALTAVRFVRPGFGILTISALRYILGK